MDIFASKLPESVIKQISVEVAKVGGINLGQGIPSLPTAPEILEAAREALVDPLVNQYPPFQGVPALRKAIVERVNNAYNLSLNFEDNILITVGCMQATATAILSILSDGDIAGVVTPNYANHFPQFLLARAKIVEIPMKEMSRWELDIAAIEEAAKRGMKLLLLTNPSNPTGAILTIEELRQLVTLAQQYGFWILADETYHYLSYGKKSASLLDFWNEYDKLVVARSFSKEFVMTGWRVGYLLASSTYIPLFSRTHDSLVGCAPRISQMAALAALSVPQEYFQKNQQIYEVRREKALTLLGALDQHFEIIAPEGAYYLFPKLRNTRDDVSFAKKLLQTQKLGVIPGSIFGEAGKGHVRLSFGVEETVFAAGIEKLQLLLVT